MSGKNDRERQRRQQRKREKRAAKSRRSGGQAGAESRGGREAGDPYGPASVARLACIETCAILLSSDGDMAPEERRELLSATPGAKGVWGRLPAELDRFLHEGAPWSLSREEVEPLRRAFARHDEKRAFDRILALSLTNEPDGAEALAAAAIDDCPQRAAVAFSSLRRSLDDPSEDRAVPLRAIVHEMEQHGANRTVQNGYRKLLDSAIASVHAAPRSRSAAVGRLARAAEKLFDRATAGHSETAWWQCGRMFLAEVFERHTRQGCAAALAGHPRLLARVFDAPRAAVWMARHGSALESLGSIPLQTDTDAWLTLLAQAVDVRSLDFENRIRFEIARLKLLKASSLRAARVADPRDGRGSGDFLRAFRELHALLAHGVPQAHRTLPHLLEAPLLDFYVDAISELHWEAAAVPVTQELLLRHPEDFRIAIVYATGVLSRREPHKLRALERITPSRHVDAGLFARCAEVWSDLPGARSAPTAVRPLLFDRLDREHRKQFLLELGRQALRRASSRETYERELRKLVPFFDRDGFVYDELRDGSAVESGLVFLATMLAPLHGIRLSLTESQSRQWISHAREIAQWSVVGGEMAVRYVTGPSPGCGLASSVAEEARARLDEFRPPRPTPPESTPTSPRPRPARPSRSGGSRSSRARPTARGGPRRATSPEPERQPPQRKPAAPLPPPAPPHTQPDLFDGLDS